MEKTILACPGCRGDCSEEGFKKISYPSSKHGQRIKNYPQSIIFCPSCSLGFAYPLVPQEELDSYYSHGDYWQDDAVKILTPKNFPGHFASAQARWQFIRPYILEKFSDSSISILDIGAGHGFLGMVAASDQGVRVRSYNAIEADKPLRDSLIKTWEQKYPNVKLNAVARPEEVQGAHDLVVLSHILEHVIDPQAFLKTVSKHVAPRGFLFIDVPNQDYLFKKDIFPHLLFFNPSALKKLIQNAGLFLKSISCFGRDQKVSPINEFNHRNFAKYFVDGIYRARKFLPSIIVTGLFGWHYGAGYANPKGTWIRVLAEK